MIFVSFVALRDFVMNRVSRASADGSSRRTKTTRGREAFF